ncbi:Myosin phosphatase [Collichthys lucidus]|uniref:Myosin phosphatase n=1 Tax=Collichthys lucidus TaxID=240159 RepID=A0A4U5VWG7_COLLU|nr:Myosin phosphatase [Collichthys lucidus]
MKHLHGYYTKSCVSKEKQFKTCADAPALTGSTSSLPDQTVMERKTKEELRNQMVGSDAATTREAHQKDLEKLKASCEEDFFAMEEMHRQLIGDLQQQHQKEVAALLKEKDQQLQNETAATMAAIVAMRRAHKQELEKSRLSHHIKENADIEQLHVQHEKEIKVLQKELEALSVQHTQKCLENSHLNKELQEERKSLMQYQKENQELKKKQDKIYAQDKLKALYGNIQDEPRHGVNKLYEDFKFATWSPSRGASGQSSSETLSALCTL